MISPDRKIGFLPKMILVGASGVCTFLMGGRAEAQREQEVNQIIPQIRCRDSGHEGMEGPHLDMRVIISRLLVGRNSWLRAESGNQAVSIGFEDGAPSFKVEFHNYIQPQGEDLIMPNKLKIFPESLIILKIFNNNPDSPSYEPEQVVWTGFCDLGEGSPQPEDEVVPEEETDNDLVA